MAQLSNVTIAILATDGFEQSELEEPKKALEAAGATVHVVSPESGSIEGWDEDDWGDAVDVDQTLDEADASAYDALVLPGGQINPDTLRINKDALDFIRAFDEAGKPIAAICHAPWLLIEAGIVKGRHATSFKSIRTDLENAGAKVRDESVVVCPHGNGPLITSRNPDDLPDFNAALIEAVGAAQPA